jgi:hypothetical protein
VVVLLGGDDARSEDPGPRIRLLVRRGRRALLTGEFEDLHGGVVVEEHLALSRLPDELFVNGLQ